ncbi:MAG: dolichyl-phosphate beta-glucosyltransferase [Nanoarchaeota archaeon]
MKISIIIPCYNEENRILKTLNKIKDYLKNKKEDFEILIVDDCSKDNTLKIVENFNLPIKILKNEINHGKGYSVKKGILNSSGDIALFMDADSATDINELDKFLPYFKEYDMVFGSRHIKKNSIKVPQSGIRRFFGFGAHKLIHLVIRTKVNDTMCGFKAFNKKSRVLFEKQLNERWGFDYELIFLAKKFGFKIKEVAVEWRDDSESKVTAKGYLKALVELFNIRLNDFLGKYK